MSQVSWKNQFTQEISGYDALEAQGLSELGFALRNGQIPQDQYLEWARDSFEAASLEIQFFETQPAPQELFEKWKDSYPWGPECLPVAEWDEHLIVACLEKPSDVPVELKPIFLIAPIQGLLKYWSQLTSDDDKRIPDDSAEKDSGGVPDGLAIDMNASVPTTLSFSGITLTKTEPEAVSAKDKTSESSHQKEVAPAASAKPTQPQRAIPVAPPLQPKTPPPLKTPEVKAEPQVLENTINLSAFNGGAEQPTLTQAIQESVEVPDLELKQVFSEVKKHYDKQLYIEYNHTKKTIQAKSWPSDFVATVSPSAYSYEQDSLFAIVQKTQKAYHGYLVANPVADKFFKEVNSGQVPENVTLVPVMKNDQLIGAFMGWGPKTAYTMTVLKDMQKAVRTMTEKLGWTSKEAA